MKRILGPDPTVAGVTVGNEKKPGGPGPKKGKGVHYTIHMPWKGGGYGKEHELLT